MRLLTLFFVLLIVELSCTSKQNENGSNQLESDTITINDNSVAAHNCNLIKRTDTVNSTMIVLSIEKEEFKRLANLHLRKVDQLKYLDSDSLETIYQRSFPKIFSLEDSSYSLK